MKSGNKFFLTSVSVWLVGCSMGFVPTNLTPAKAYGEYWFKDGITLTQRREDSWACGAAKTVHAADYVVFSAEQERAEKRLEETDNFAARARLSRAWVECMKVKGYYYQK